MIQNRNRDLSSCYLTTVSVESNGVHPQAETSLLPVQIASPTVVSNACSISSEHFHLAQRSGPVNCPRTPSSKIDSLVMYALCNTDQMHMEPCTQAHNLHSQHAANLQPHTCQADCSNAQSKYPQVEMIMDVLHVDASNVQASALLGLKCVIPDSKPLPEAILDSSLPQCNPPSAWQAETGYPGFTDLAEEAYSNTSLEQLSRCGSGQMFIEKSWLACYMCVYAFKNTDVFTWTLTNCKL